MIVACLIIAALTWYPAADWKDTPNPIANLRARRGGTTATFDQLNKYFTIAGMPVASSQYWNNIHGRLPGEAAQDTEGLQTMRTLARNMSFLMKSIALGKEIRHPGKGAVGTDPFYSIRRPEYERSA